MLLSNISIKRPVLATVMMLALVTLGSASYRRLAIDLYPNVEIPVITIVTIYPGASQVVVEFQLEVNTDRAAQDARTKIAAIRGDLPATIEDPIIEKLDIGGMPIVSLAVRSTSLSPRDLTALVETKVQRRLENVLGVGKVDLIGPVTREVSVEVQPDRLDALGMGVDEVIAGLRGENIDTPLGRMTSRGAEG